MSESFIFESTARPWKWTGHGDHPLHEGPVVESVTGAYVCECAIDGIGFGNADAQLICQAVNEREILLECEQALREFRHHVVHPLASKIINARLASLDEIRSHE